MAVPWQCHGSAITVPKVSSGDCKATPRGCSEDFEASPRGVRGSSKEVESSSKVVEKWVRSGCKVSKTHFWGKVFLWSKNHPGGFSWFSELFRSRKMGKMGKLKMWKYYNFCSARTGPDQKTEPARCFSKAAVLTRSPEPAPVRTGTSGTGTRNRTAGTGTGPNRNRTERFTNSGNPEIRKF